MVTIQNIARSTGLAATTVSAILRNRPHCYASEKTKAKVKALADSMGYVPNLMARGLKTGHTRTVGLLLATTYEVHIKDLQLLDRLFLKENYLLLSYLACNEFSRIEAGCTELIRRGCDGLILDAFLLPETLERFSFINQRTVWVTHCELQQKKEQENLIFYDLASGMMELIRHLLSLGHRKMVWVGRASVFPRDGRRTGFQALLPDQPMVELEEEFMTPQLLKALLETWPGTTVLICSNDHIAFSVLRAAQMLGIKVPEQLSVTGFDDNRLSGAEYGNLSSVKFPHEEGCASIVNQLLNMLENRNLPVSRCCTSTFIPRGTTGPVPPASLAAQIQSK